MENTDPSGGPVDQNLARLTPSISDGEAPCLEVDSDLQPASQDDTSFAGQTTVDLLDYESMSLEELLGIDAQENDWIIEGLIHAGDQVVLAGPPKIGKSILSYQLALTVAEGKGKFLREDFIPQPKPRKVLVLSFEMNAPMVGKRLQENFKRRADCTPSEIPLTFVF